MEDTKPNHDGGLGMKSIESVRSDATSILEDKVKVTMEFFLVFPKRTDRG